MGAAVNIGLESAGGTAEVPSVHTAQRLTSAMSSRKLQALTFIKQYYVRWGKSPTLRELAAELGVSGKRAHALVHQLSDERQLEVTGKTRGIRLLDPVEELSEADVLLRLRALGWTVALDGGLAPPPSDTERGSMAQQVTEKGLHRLPLLDHEEPLDAAGADTAAGEQEGNHGQGQEP